MNPQIQTRLTIVKFLILTALATSMALSYKLWLSGRFFPLTPAFDFLPKITSPLDFIILYAAAILIALNFIYPKVKKITLALILVLFLLALFDQNRWQPWFFQYFFMLLAFVYTDRNRLGFAELEVRLKTLQLIIAGVYFWSGINKLNTSFYSDVVPWLNQPFREFLPENITSFTKYFISAIPFVEVFIGIGLFLPKLKKAALIFAIITHLFILIVIGPLGYNYNVVIWPWNIAMMLFVIILFYNMPSSLPFNIKTLWKHHTIKLAILLFWFLPVLNLFNLWPAYLSSSLYSGNTSNAVIYLSDKTVSFIPEDLSVYLDSKTPNTVNIKAWSMNELNVPAFPEKKVFFNVRNYIYQYTTDSSEVVMSYSEKSSLFNKPETEIY